MVFSKWFIGFLFLLCIQFPAFSQTGEKADISYPPSLDSYHDAELTNLIDILANRIEKQPFNLWATVLFVCAIVHTFMTHRFRHIAHVLEEKHHGIREKGETERTVSVPSRIFHFLGELEAVFGIWVVPLIIAMNFGIGAGSSLNYIDNKVNFTEAVFVVVIMTIASTRPILQLAERIMQIFAKLGGEKPVAWWLSILLVGPLLGSFITEPAAMTICAMLLSKKFYSLKPSNRLSYGTIGLLFVAISIGGTLTHFAAPPVLMVVDAWGWDLPFMLTHFGWKAALGIGLGVGAYYSFFRKELTSLSNIPDAGKPEENLTRIPVWVTIGHLLFMVFAVYYSHHPPYLIFGMLFFLAFVEVTEDFQQDFSIRPPILVGFFLAGLVIHGGLQQWWIAPVLGSLGEIPLMLGAMTLTAFNDNAAITYLCTLVPTFTEGMKYAAVAGAVAGGGLTVIANAPNPAGVSILGKHFEDGVSALGLLTGALVPTIIALLCFMIF
ncbi:MAG: putative Na+/H+ antiporter [Ignavibacteria bacterium]|nr:putative Na+/H+ antiporter [Ignavibacteria bacterium]